MDPCSCNLVDCAPALGPSVTGNSSVTAQRSPPLRLVGLRLAANGLRGQLPAHPWGNFSELQHLDLSSNRIFGAVPSGNRPPAFSVTGGKVQGWASYYSIE